MQCCMLQSWLALQRLRYLKKICGKIRYWLEVQSTQDITLLIGSTVWSYFQYSHIIYCNEMTLLYHNLSTFLIDISELI